MFLVVTTLVDPDLPLLAVHPDLALVVPGHLSQPGWRYESGRIDHARLWTSRGAIHARDVRGVLTRFARVRPTDLPHVHEEDRDYVAAEMTAFLAALLCDMPCPMFNRPTAVHLAGPAWTEQRAWRAAAQESMPICMSDDPPCGDAIAVAVVDGEPLADHDLSARDAETTRRLAVLSGMRLVQVDLCRRHGGVRRVLPFARLNDRLLARLIETGARDGALP